MGLLSYRALNVWLPSYVGWLARRPPRRSRPVHLLVAICDHFEPFPQRRDPEAAQRRVDEWVRLYPEIASCHTDSDGRHPRHTWFYPWDEYHPGALDALFGLESLGFGEVELHLHHDGDTSESLRDKLEQAKEALSRHAGAPRRTFGFIHGNWALDNSLPGGRWCGVNNELQVLAEAGCYADFTFPSLCASQPRQINSIYYATDDPDRPKSYDRGRPARVGGMPDGDLLLVQGPLALDWRRRRRGLFPAIESGELSVDNLPSPRRTDVWVNVGVRVLGRPEWIFIKLHTHGGNDRNAAMLLGGELLERLWSDLEARYNDGERYMLHYVTAREMYNLAKAAEAGAPGPPEVHRDYAVPPYRAPGESHAAH